MLIYVANKVSCLIDERFMTYISLNSFLILQEIQEPRAGLDKLSRVLFLITLFFYLLYPIRLFISLFT